MQASILHHIAPSVDAQEHEQQDGEAPKRRTSVAKERQRDADNRRQTKHHTHIYEHMEEENT